MTLTVHLVSFANASWVNCVLAGLCGGGALPRQDGVEPRHHTKQKF